MIEYLITGMMVAVGFGLFAGMEIQKMADKEKAK